MKVLMQWTWLAIGTGFLVDCYLGDPQGFPHPVVWMGKAISGLEKSFRKHFPQTPGGEFAAGLVLALILVLGSGALSGLLLWLGWKGSPILYYLIASFMAWQIFAARSLKVEAEKVGQKLAQEGLEAGRAQVAMLVGRDTAQLSEEGVIKACIETVAENTSDGVIAPLFWMIIGGPAAGFAYKAINTMDSMLGYRNEKYMNFGHFPAKLDDVANYLPARLCAWGMIKGADLAGFDGTNARRIRLRDGRKPDSPNAGLCEAVCAGALHIQLGGDATYFGQVFSKPNLGDPDRPVELDDIARATGLMYTTSFFLLAVLVCLGELVVMLI